MKKLPLTLACGPYDRVHALLDGSVAPEGIDLNFIPLEVEEIFWRQIKHYEFDAAECSMSSYTMLRSKGDDRFIAIPVFTSRMFRHSCIFVNSHKNISAPEDLKGKVIGVPEYQITAAVWERGMMADEYGVLPKDLFWRSGGEETPGREEKVALKLPSDINYEAIPEHQTLSRMLDAGEVDALFTARAPSCFLNGSPNVKRLFENYKEVEAAYFQKTGYFPIMHLIVIKREVYEANPWVAMSLYKACCQAKEIAIRNCLGTAVLGITLPWVLSEAEETRRIFGEDWWPYGVTKNRDTLETFFRYHYEQGLSPRKMTVEELFAPETFDEFKV